MDCLSAERRAVGRSPSESHLAGDQGYAVSSATGFHSTLPIGLPNRVAAPPAAEVRRIAFAPICPQVGNQSPETCGYYTANGQTILSKGVVVAPQPGTTFRKDISIA
jgi:hypothetical protein